MLTADGLVTLVGQPWYVHKHLIAQSYPGLATCWTYLRIVSRKAPMHPASGARCGWWAQRPAWLVLRVSHLLGSPCRTCPQVLRLPHLFRRTFLGASGDAATYGSQPHRQYLKTQPHRNASRTQPSRAQGEDDSSPAPRLAGRSAAQPPWGYQVAAVPPAAEIFAKPQVSRVCRLHRTVGASALVGHLPLPTPAFGIRLSGEHP